MEVTYLHTDHLGTVSIATNANAQVLARTLNMPYGSARWISGTLPTDWGYTGQKDTGLGLTYMHARYYASGIGRFISADTIVPNPNDPISFNRFVYVSNNPLLYIDPTGHDRDCGIGDSRSCRWRAKAENKLRQYPQIPSGLRSGGRYGKGELDAFGETWSIYVPSSCCVPYNTPYDRGNHQIVERYMDIIVLPDRFGIAGQIGVGLALQNLPLDDIPAGVPKELYWYNWIHVSDSGFAYVDVNNLPSIDDRFSSIGPSEDPSSPYEGAAGVADLAVNIGEAANINLRTYYAIFEKDGSARRVVIFTYYLYMNTYGTQIHPSYLSFEEGKITETPVIYEPVVSFRRVPCWGVSTCYSTAKP